MTEPAELDAFTVTFAPPEVGWIDIFIEPFSAGKPITATWHDDPFPAMFAWLEAIAGGADSARWLITEEGRQTHIIFLRARHGGVDFTHAQLIVLVTGLGGRSDVRLGAYPVTPLGVVKAFYSAFRALVENSAYDPSHWEFADDEEGILFNNDGSPLRKLQSALLEAVSQRPAPENGPLSRCKTEHLMTQNDAEIRRILTTTRRIAVVGASDKPSRPSNGVTRFLIECGYDVTPVNPALAGKPLHGRTAVGSLWQAEPLDMVDLFRASEEVTHIVRDAIRRGARTIWMQLGVVNRAAALEAEAAGLTVVMDRCPHIEWGRLGLTKQQLQRA